LGRDWDAAVFVWGSWALMLLALLVLIARYGYNGPMWWDELGTGIVPRLLGGEPVTLGWLWEPYGEHRLILSKLTMVGLAKLTGSDFRAPMFVSALGLAVLASLLIRTAVRIRGKVSVTDVILPFALLNFGYAWDLLQGFTINQTAPTLLGGILLAVIARSRRGLSLRNAVLTSACLFLLPMWGAAGILFVPTLSLWLAYSGALGWLSARRPAGQDGPAPDPAADPGRRKALLIMGLAAGNVLWAVTFSLNVERSLPAPDSPWQALRASLQFLSLMFGPGARSTFPYSGLLALVLLLLSVALLVAVWFRQPRERFRAFGLLCFLGGVGLLALAIGWGRATSPQGGSGPWYYVLAVPALCCAYLSGVVYQDRGGRLLQWCLLLSTTLFLLPDLDQGLFLARTVREGFRAFEKDVRAGMPIGLLVDRYSGRISVARREAAASDLALLRRTRFGVYRHLVDDIRMKEVMIASEPDALDGVLWKDGVGYGHTNRVSLGYTLERPRFIYALRIKCSMNYGNKDSRPVDFRVSWGRGVRENPQAAWRVAGADLDVGPGERTAVVWVNEEIDSIRIHPDDKPFVIRHLEIRLLVPEGPGERRTAGLGKPTPPAPTTARGVGGRPAIVPGIDSTPGPGNSVSRLLLQKERADHEEQPSNAHSRHRWCRLCRLHSRYNAPGPRP